MSYVLKVREEDKEIQLTPIFVSNDGTDTFFLGSDSEKIKIPIPFILSKPFSYKLDEFLMWVVYQKEPSESAIFQVYEKTLEDKEGRIGWIFPLHSILSSDHDYANNEHFLVYANAAFRKLLYGEGQALEAKSLNYAAGRTYSLSDFYPDNAIILIVYKKDIAKLKDFDLTDYLPSIYSNGYSNNINVKKMLLQLKE